MASSPEQKPSKIDRILKAGVLLNVITVPFWIAIGRPDIALLDIGTGVATEKVRNNISKFRGRNRISGYSRTALVEKKAA